MAAESLPDHPWLNRRRWQAVRLSRRMRHRMRIGWRRPLAPWRALPRFIILGAQKSGTSSLYAQLTAHPQVWSASWKEVHYFDLHHEKSLAWYRAHFPLVPQLERNDAVTGEASPYYLCHPHAAERIAKVLPEVTLIALLRNPVARAISHYWHQVKRGRERLPLAEALAAEEERLAEDGKDAGGSPQFGYNHFHFSYKERGFYHEQLERYCAHFSKEQMLLIKSEDFFNDPQHTYDRVTRHVGLAPHKLPDAGPRNAGSYPKAPPTVRRKLKSHFEAPNRALYDLVGASEPWWN